jgi:signal transduction histidine kinase
MPRLLSRRTVRFRMAALISALLLGAGAALLAITYGLVESSTTVAFFAAGGTDITVRDPPDDSGQHYQATGAPTAAQLQLARQLYAKEAAQRTHDLHQLLIESGFALGIMAVLAVGLGWLLAGRMLRPLRVMKAAAHRISERNLHERLDLPGPRDEVKDLADTIDGLLGRLERAFAAQRRFVASASHELRTPLTLTRALLEVALADPAADAAELRTTCEELLAAAEHQERLIDGLLTLATSERGLDRRDRFDLAEVARRALEMHRAQADERALAVTSAFDRAIVSGDPDLAERMAANLIDNAIRYNLPGGTVSVTVGPAGDRPVLAVANTGPVIPADHLDRLFQPFQRMAAGHPGQPGHPDGHGLGLSIVHSIAAAHDASLDVQAQPNGGLTIEARFPSPTGPCTGTESEVAGAAHV